jgi:4,5-DOPA dioxygenase extradiol
MPTPGSSRLPVLFVSHGSPMVALEADDYTRALQAWPTTIPRPTAIVVVSAHWQAPRPVRVATSPAPVTIHDFYGFPPELYALQYAATGAPGLAAAIIERLRDAGIPAEPDPGRGLDHGAWVPLRFLYPGIRAPTFRSWRCPSRRRPARGIS